MRLDVPTLLVVLAGLTLMLAMGMLVQSRRSANARYMLNLALALLLVGPGFLLVALRGLIPDWISIVVANAGILAGLGMCWNGFRAFNHRRPRPAAVVIPPLLWVLACLHPHFYASFPLRTAAAWTGITLFAFGLSYEIWIRGADRLPARRPIGVLCLAAAIVAFTEVAFSLLHRHQVAVRLNDGWASLPILFSIYCLFGATILSLVMTQQRTVHRLRRQASQDALTGLLNRGAFVEAASAQLKAATLTDSDIGLLLFDLDRFKEVNDGHGHAAGDAVLVAFAEILRRSLRQTDVIGRIGGEEFAALLTGVDARRANLIAEGIRLELARLAIDHAGTAIATTVSVGLTIARARETGLTSLMERTDGALYMAKRGGRDRVETAPA